MARVSKTYGTLLIVGVVLLAGPVLAQQYPGWNKPGGTPGSYANEIKFFDRNNDGKIDQHEFQTGQQTALTFIALNWNGMDRNHDGQISRDEFVQAYGTAYTAAGVSQMGRNQGAGTRSQTSSLTVYLNGLASDQHYTAELNALRKAVSNWSNDETVITYLTTHAQQYPQLLPAVRSWVWQNPARQELRRHFAGDAARPVNRQAKFSNAAGRAQPAPQRQAAGSWSRPPTSIQTANARPATPTIKQATKPNQQTTFKSAQKRIQQPAYRSATRSNQQTMIKPAAKPNSQSAYKRATQPNQQPAYRPTTKLNQPQQTMFKPAAKPAWPQPAFKPAPPKPQNQPRTAPTGTPQSRGPVYQR
jgi:hypothetical protein